MAITSTGEQTLKTIINLTPGLYFVSYTQALTYGSAGIVYIYCNNDKIIYENAGTYSDASPIHSLSGIINVTSKEDVIKLKYTSTKTNSTVDRFYSWQFMRVR